MRHRRVQRLSLHRVSNDADYDAFDRHVDAQLLNDQRATIWTATDAAGRMSFEVRLPAAQPNLRELEGAR
jgi:hypothetical protein